MDSEFLELSFTGKKTSFFSAATAVKGVAKDSSILRGFAMNKIIPIIKKVSTSILGRKHISFIFRNLVKIMSTVFSNSLQCPVFAYVVLRFFFWRLGLFA